MIWTKKKAANTWNKVIFSQSAVFFSQYKKNILTFFFYNYHENPFMAVNCVCGHWNIFIFFARVFPRFSELCLPQSCRILFSPRGWAVEAGEWFVFAAWMPGVSIFMQPWLTGNTCSCASRRNGAEGWLFCCGGEAMHDSKANTLLHTCAVTWSGSEK